MNNKQLEEIWRKLDTRIETINQRTKIQTIKIKELEKRIKQLENGNKNNISK
jgi:chaperonin cofactor prefoldin